jgi:hypothetical protein
VASKLAEDNLSDDKDEGMGGGFIGGSFDSFSDELRLLNDCNEGFLERFISVSLLLMSKIALSGLLLAFFCRTGCCLGEGIFSGNGLDSLPSTLEDREKERDAVFRGIETGSALIETDCLFSGEVLRDFANFRASLGDGEGDLDDDDFHDLLARLRMVLETERLVDAFVFSVTSTAVLLVSFPATLSRSSVEKVNLVIATFPFPPLDALRSSSLLDTYGEFVFLGDPSGERAKTLSEKVRLMPSAGCISCTPGRCV